MDVLKVIGVYVLGHLMCINAACDDSSYEADYNKVWCLLALPSSFLTHGHVLAVRVACSINIGAILIILYLFTCTGIDVTPIRHSDIFSLYVFWILSTASFEMFRKERHLSKKETTREHKNIRRALACLGLISSIFCFVFFVGHIIMLLS